MIGSRLIRIENVQPERVEWLWLHRLPLGKVAILDGDPGLGKSTMLLDIAARVTTGERMPGCNLGPVDPRNVVILSAEDGLGDTIRPRLEAAGADLSRVHALDAILDEEGERLPEVPGDLFEIEAAVTKTRAALLIIDPLMAYLGGEVNSYRDQDVRRALSGLKGLAERTGAATAVVRHLTKGGAGNPVYRGGGSIGIIGAARSGLLVAVDPDDESGERRILASTKSNLGPPPPALAYRMVSHGDTARIEWLGTVAHTAASLLAQPQTEEEKGARGEAMALLRDLLADGPIPAKAAQRSAREAGIAPRTLDRAKAQLGVRAYREGGIGADGSWLWELPRYANNAEDRHPHGMASFGESGDLRARLCLACHQPIPADELLINPNRARCIGCYVAPPGVTA